MELKHTAAPWEVTPMNNVYSGNKEICALPSTSEEAKANARLIAASPRLLQALINLHNKWQAEIIKELAPKFHLEIAEAQEAIKDALGE